MLRFLCLTLVCVIFVTEVVHGRSVSHRRRGSKHTGRSSSAVDDDIDPDKYLEQYGYLNQLPTDAGHSQEARQEAIRNFQRMTGLYVTGDMDDDTHNQMLKPRCGMPDMIPQGQMPEGVMLDPTTNQHKPESYYTPGYKWNKTDLAWKVLGYSHDMDEGSQRLAFYEAFEHWSKVSPLNFNEVGSNSNADININFAYGEHGDGAGNAFDGRGGVLAHAFYPTGGDTHFDEGEDWTQYTNDGTNLMIVAAHEFGHALGIGHSSVPEALMAPYYSGYNPNFELHSDDIGAIQSLYGRREDENPEQPSTPSTTPRPSGPSGSPDPCMMKYDAMVQAHDAKIYIFRGEWVFRVDEYDGLEDGFPRRTREIYPGAPINMGAAVYSWRTRYTYFFKGNKVWKYYGFHKVQKKTIHTSGYPMNVMASFLGRDGNIYLLSGSRYWVFDEYRLDVVSSRSESTSLMWPGIPTNVEAAVRLRDGYVYFIKGYKYRKYDEYYKKVLPGYPKLKATAWMGTVCNGGDKRISKYRVSGRRDI